MSFQYLEIVKLDFILFFSLKQILRAYLELNVKEYYNA